MVVDIADSAELLSLHDKFLSLISSRPIHVISFAERCPTFVRGLNLELRFVEDESSWLEVGQMFGVPLDHLSVCKPAVRSVGIRFQKLLLGGDIKISHNSHIVV